MKSYIILFFVAAMLLQQSCKPKERIIEIEKEVLKTEYRDRLQRDSIYIQDSIYIREKGDTVFLHKNHYHYRDRLLRDTVNVVDSIYIEKPVQVKVPVNVLTKWQRWRLNALNIIVLLAVLYVVWRVRFSER